MRQAIFNDEIRILKKLPSSEGGIQFKSLPRKVSMMFKWKRTKTDTGRQVWVHQGEQVIIG